MTPESFSAASSSRRSFRSFLSSSGSAVSFEARASSCATSSSSFEAACSCVSAAAEAFFCIMTITAVASDMMTKSAPKRMSMFLKVSGSNFTRFFSLR